MRQVIVTQSEPEPEPEAEIICEAADPPREAASAPEAPTAKQLLGLISERFVSTSQVAAAIGEATGVRPRPQDARSVFAGLAPDHLAKVGDVLGLPWRAQG